MGKHWCVDDAGLTDAVRGLLHEQSGVISRKQAGQLGLAPADLERLKRKRLWVPTFPGVFVEHSGPLTYDQRVWSAVLYSAPSAAAGRTAMRIHERNVLAPLSEPIEVVIPGTRRVRGREGLHVRRCDDFTGIVLDLHPPRLRYEYAVLDVASSMSTIPDTMTVLAGAVGSRRSTATRLLETLEGLPNLRHRRRISLLLQDIRSGIHSVLEHDYRRLVEEPHGLPRGKRQRRVSRTDGTVYQDVAYDWLIVELDGAHHREADQHHADLERDLDAKIEGEESVRVGYHQVYDRSCRTGYKLAVLLRLLGWRGEPHACQRPGCAVAALAP